MVFFLCSLPPQFPSVYKPSVSSAYHTPEREQLHVSQNGTRTDSLGFVESVEKNTFQTRSVRRTDITTGTLFKS